MATTIQKITLSTSRDIPFNKLVLSQANVRRGKAGVSIEELAEDIARRTLLQGLSVRAVIDADGTETGMFEVPAGGRRFRALELLVKQKRLAKTAPVLASCGTAGSPRRTRWPRTSSASRSTRSISSAPSRHYVRRASAMKRSPHGFS
jgi:ParB family chromosome partitioning protein